MGILSDFIKKIWKVKRGEIFGASFCNGFNNSVS